MFKSSKKRSAPWPWRIRILYLTLGISLFVNAIVLSFMVYTNSRESNLRMSAAAIASSCVQNYAYNLSRFNSNNDRIMFSEGLCRRDVNNGAELNNVEIVNGHLVPIKE